MATDRGEVSDKSLNKRELIFGLVSLPLVYLSRPQENGKETKIERGRMEVRQGREIKG